MHTLFTILDMVIAALCLYQAGKFAAAIEFDKDIFKEKTPMHMHVLYWLNLFFGLYLLIAIYGRGIERGLM